MIRPVVAADADAIFLILSEHAKAGSPGSPRWDIDQVKEECGAGGWVSTGSTGVEGFILYRTNADALEITYLASAFGALRKGVMKSLLAHMSSVKPNDKAIWLEVHEANHAAQALYERMGFREVGRRPKYYADGATAILFSLG